MNPLFWLLAAGAGYYFYKATVPLASGALPSGLSTVVLPSDKLTLDSATVLFLSTKARLAVATSKVTYIVGNESVFVKKYTLSNDGAGVALSGISEPAEDLTAYSVQFCDKSELAALVAGTVASITVQRAFGSSSASCAALFNYFKSFNSNLRTVSLS